MRCPKCGCEESKVVDSRPAENNDSIRRRRECVSCGFRFTTYERREELPLVVLKHDGSKEPFDREKLMRGLVRATVKRDVPIDVLDKLIGDIESELKKITGPPRWTPVPWVRWFSTVWQTSTRWPTFDLPPSIVTSRTSRSSLRS